MVLAPVGWLQVAPAATGPAGSHQVMGDFNGDGFDDMAVGAPADDEAGPSGSGAVNVIYGSASGLTDEDNQLWYQDAGILQDPPEQQDSFGGSLMAGNFDGDGFDDLAIGAPTEDVGTEEAAGAVHVLYGSMTGLTATGNQLFVQGQDDLPGPPIEAGFFGFSVAAGDINSDGRDDLVVGSPADEIDGVQGGSATVVYGSPMGLTTVGSQRLHQNSSGVNDTIEDEESFGLSMVLADFGRTRTPDLAVGVAGEGTAGRLAGAVAVLYSRGGRIRTSGDQLLRQGRGRIPGVPGDQDLFGLVLAAGNFGGSRHAELAVGAPGEQNSRGAVYVLQGSPNGLSGRGSQMWHRASRGIAGDRGIDDMFGQSLAAGNFGRTRHADLAVGVPTDDVDGQDEAGAVNVIYGSRRGLTARMDQLWHQGKTPGDLVEAEDEFGVNLGAGNFGDGRRGDLAVGGVGEDSSSGVVLVLSGRPAGLSGDAAEYWDQDVGGILGTAGPGDLFGIFGPCFEV